jgi:hypothetical protein
MPRISSFFSNHFCSLHPLPKAFVFQPGFSASFVKSEPARSQPEHRPNPTSAGLKPRPGRRTTSYLSLSLDFHSVFKKGMLDRSSKPQQPAEPRATGAVDRLLFKNLVEMVPLVESLMVSAAPARRSRRCGSFSLSLGLARAQPDLALPLFLGCSKIGRRTRRTPAALRRCTRRRRPRR